MFCIGCGASLAAGSRFCANCGRPTPIDVAGSPPPASAAPPPTYAPAPPTLKVPHRRGNRLIVPRGAGGMPPFCAKCGAPAAKTINKSFQWHNPWYYLIALLSPIIYVVVAAFVMKRMVFAVPLCAAHATERRWKIFFAAVALCASVPAGIALAYMLPDRWGLWNVLIVLGVCLGGFLGSVIWLVRTLNMISPKLIDEERGEFTGVSEEFFRQLPAVAAGQSA